MTSDTLPSAGSGSSPTMTADTQAPAPAPAGAPEALTFTYTNWRGEMAERRVKPDSIRVGWGSNEWHPEPQFLMSAFDLDKGQFRDFAWKDILFAAAQADFMVDDEGGCSWSRMDWPKSFATVPHPLSWQGNLLAADQRAGEREQTS